MSHLSSTIVNAMHPYQVHVVSLYRLAWRDLPAGDDDTWDEFAAVSYWSRAIRFYLFPLLEPDRVTGPFTTIADAGVNAGKPVTDTDIANAHASLCGLTRNTGETDDELNRRCLQTEPVS